MSRPFRDGWSILLSLGVGAWSASPVDGTTERAAVAIAPPAPRAPEPPSRIDIVVHRPDDAAATLALAQRHALELARDDAPKR